MKVLLAKVISRISGPEAVMPLCFIALLVLKAGLALWQVAYLVPALLFFDWLAPLLLFLVLYKLGKVSDIDISRRSERPLLLIVATASLVLAAVFCYLWGNALVFRLQLIMVILSAVITGVTFFYKVSLHTSSNTFLVLVLGYFYGRQLWWVALLLIPVAWARWELKKHTKGQLALGVLLSAAITLTGMAIWV